MIPFFTAGLGGALMVSAGSKVPDRSQLLAFLGALGVPPRATSTAARLTVAAEAVVGIALVMGLANRVVLLAALLLTAAFLVVQLVARIRNTDVKCGCLGFLEADSGKNDELVRALVFFVFTALLALAAFRWSFTHEALARTLGAFAGAAALLANANLRYATRMFRNTKEGLSA